MRYLDQLRRSLAIARKDVWIYYAKGPVMVFGIIFPLFLLMAFTIGRNMTVRDLFPGLMGMAIFFTSTAVGPAILPWEARSRTLERLVTAPVGIWALLLGDVIASFVFGIMISLIPLAVAVLMGVEVLHVMIFLVGMLLATFCFASLSILLSAYPPTDVPATVMMLSSLVRFPLVFISGVFVPVDQLPGWGRAISSVSPLTYFVDLARYSISGISYYSVNVDLAVMGLFAVVFLVTAIRLHERFLPQRLS